MKTQKPEEEVNAGAAEVVTAPEASPTPEQQVKALNEKLEAVYSEKVELFKENAGLLEKLESAGVENDLLKEQLEAAEATIASLKEALTEAPTETTGKEKFVYGDKTYEILGSVNIPNKGVRTPLEITADKDAQAWLVEKGSGIVREVK